MSGHVLQVNISRGGLPKRPIFEGALGTGGFEGDAWAHPEVHGGFGQAVLLIAAEAIQELAARGYPVFPGALGENITTEGLDRRKWRSGQRFRVGAARIELTKIRTPCRTLDAFGRDGQGIAIQKAIYNSAVKLGDVSSDLWAVSGFYALVLKTGIVRPGDDIVLESELA